MNEITTSNRLPMQNSIMRDQTKNKDLSFSERLKTAVSEVNSKHHDANQAMEKVMQDKMGIHEGMLAIQEADVSLRLLIQVRAKVMAAYNEVMHMQF